MTTEQTPRRFRILIVEDQTLVGLGLKAQVEAMGHSVVDQAADEQQAIEQYTRHQPDLVLMDIRLDGVDGIDVSEKLLAIRRCPIIIVTAYSEPAMLERAGKVGVFGYLIKPVQSEALAAQIEVAISRFNEQTRLLQANLQLSQTLENRKLIEKAKGIFMKRFDLPEPEAHRKLQLESQKRRLSLPELARKVIESEELLGGL